jgi:exonuclease SbcD
MKFIASGDHHWDEHSRFDECIRIHSWMVDLVRRERPDVFLSAGDIYERASTPKEREEVAAWLVAIAEVSPVVVVKGNHDRAFDAHLLRRLKSVHPIIVDERCGVHRVGGAAIATLAWPSRASILAMLGRSASSQDADVAATLALQDVLRGLGAELAEHDGPRVLLTHAMIDGAVTSLGQPLIGAEMRITLSDLALAQAQVVIAGHIHCPQRWDYGAMPVIYTGSPFRTAFGETEEKSVLLVEIDGATVRCERVPTPATPMLLIEGVWRPESGSLDVTSETAPVPQRCTGAEVRLRYTVDADHRDAAKRALSEQRQRLMDAGARSVKLEEVVTATVRARAPEIAAAKTLEEKLGALWRARKNEPTPERAARLITKTHELESEVAA